MGRDGVGRASDRAHRFAIDVRHHNRIPMLGCQRQAGMVGHLIDVAGIGGCD